MPALVAGIHAFLLLIAPEGVNGRDKPGHDGLEDIAGQQVRSAVFTAMPPAIHDEARQGRAAMDIDILSARAKWISINR